MKKLLLLILCAIVFACSQKSEDIRPKEQVRLATIVKELRDSANAFESVPDARYNVLHGGVVRVKNFIIDSLGQKFTNWQVRVLDVSADKSEVAYGMNIDGGEMTESTRFKSIVFETRAYQNDTAFATISRNLKLGDVVTISGTFNSSGKNINIDPYKKKSQSKNIFDNPAFRVVVNSLDSGE